MPCLEQFFCLGSELNGGLQPAFRVVPKLQIMEVRVYSLDDPTKVLDTMYIKAIE